MFVYVHLCGNVVKWVLVVVLRDAALTALYVHNCLWVLQIFVCGPSRRFDLIQSRLCLEHDPVYNCVCAYFVCVRTWFHCTFVCRVYSTVGSELSCDSASSSFSGLQQLLKMISEGGKRKYFTY